MKPEYTLIRVRTPDDEIQAFSNVSHISKTDRINNIVAFCPNSSDSHALEYHIGKIVEYVWVPKDFPSTEPIIYKRLAIRISDKATILYLNVSYCKSFVRNKEVWHEFDAISYNREPYHVRVSGEIEDAILLGENLDKETENYITYFLSLSIRDQIQIIKGDPIEIRWIIEYLQKQR